MNVIISNNSRTGFWGKDADKTLVGYVLQDYQRPMGVATYKTTGRAKLKELLPDEEEMKKLL